MLANLKARREDEEGFTLIELMVVVLIIAILIAIAIPTFLGARERAQERAAQSSARNAFTAAKTLFTDAESYTPVSDATLLDVETSLTYSAAEGGQSTGPNNISWQRLDLNADVSAHEGVIIASKAKNDMCFALMEINLPAGGLNPGVHYAKYQSDAGTPCVSAGSPAAAPGGATWVANW